MVVSFMSYRPHPRQTSPCSPVSHLPYTLPSSVSCKPFVCHSYENCRGVHQQFPFWNEARAEQAERPVPALPSTHVLSFHILANSFALPENSTTLFSIDSALFVKKHRGVGAGGDEMLTQDRVRISVRTSSLLFVPTSSSYRKQHWLSGRTVGNLFKLREVPPERLRHFHLRSLQDADELQGIDHCLALKMVVGNHKGLARPLRHFADARCPGRELYGIVKIVVALLCGDGLVVAKPRVVAPPVKPHVPDTGSGLSGRAKRSSDDGLIDVAETNPAAVQQFQSSRRIPCPMPHFDDQWIVGEALEQRRKISNGLFRAMKRKRKLQQDRAELIRRTKHIEAGANIALLRRGGAGRRGPCVVRESLPQLGRKDKSRIRRYSFDPLRRVLRVQRLVKRSINLDGVKVFREIGRLVESFGASSWIDIAGPVGIRPACGADAHGIRCGRGIARPGTGRKMVFV